MSTAISPESSAMNADVRRAVCRWKRSLRHGAQTRIEKRYLAFVNDLCLTNPHNQHPMGTLPEAAIEFGRAGASLPDLVAPFELAKAHVLNVVCGESLPALMEVVSREQEASNQQDHATFRMLTSDEPHVIEQYIESCNVQIEETVRARQVALRKLNRRVTA